MLVFLNMEMIKKVTKDKEYKKIIIMTMDTNLKQAKEEIQEETIIVGV
jgi:hypothetical protein